MKVIKINQPETRGTVITTETMEVNQKRVFELNELYQRDARNEAIFGDTFSLHNLFATSHTWFLSHTLLAVLFLRVRNKTILCDRTNKLAHD